MGRKLFALFGFALYAIAGGAVPGLKDASLSVLIEEIGKCPSDKNLLDLVNMKVSKLNRTAFEVRGNFLIKQDVTNTSVITVSMYSGKNKRWANTPLLERVTNFCKFVKEDKRLWPRINAFLHLPNECPLPMGNYTIQTANVQMTGVPPLYPMGCYKMEFKMTEGRYSLGCMFVIVNLSGASGSPSRQCI